MAILGGICLFLIMLVLFIYPQTDFDQQLIISVDNEVPSSILIPQIEEEGAKERSKTRNKFLSRLMDQKFWFQIDRFNESGIQFYKGVYIRHMKFINEQEELRKEFVIKKITEEEFKLETKRLEEDYFTQAI